LNNPRIEVSFFTTWFHRHWVPQVELQMGRIRVALEERLRSPELLVDEAVNSWGPPGSAGFGAGLGMEGVALGDGKPEERPGFSQGSIGVCFFWWVAGFRD
jgi:hypothetical protein